MKRIMVAVPCAEMLDVGFVNSLEHMKRIEQTDVAFLPGSLIYDARNALAKEAVAGGYDYVLWLDSDMTFGEDLLERMMESLGDEPILTGLYFERKGEYKPTIFTKCKVEVSDDDYQVITERALDIPEKRFLVEGCGFGAVLMKAEVLKAIYDSQGNPFSPYIGLGEDLSFCIRAGALGYRIVCDPTITLGHMAHVPVGGKNLIIKWNTRKR